MRRYILITTLFVAIGYITNAQIIISGSVLDGTNDEPLIGAFVSVGALNVHAVTDVDGTFQLIVPTPKAVKNIVLSSSILGYREGQEVLELLPVDDGETITKNFVLEADPLTLRDVIVTANKVEEELQNVPIAVTALTSLDLVKRNISNTDEAFTSIPNIVTDAYLPSQSTFSVRGLASDIFNGPGFENTVGFYIDDVYYSRSYHFNQLLMDINRVEALRGPQGTLFGKNSVGGVLHVINEEPKMSNFGAVELSAGNFQLLQVRAKGNFMLAKDKLALRVTGAYSQREGWMIDENPNTEDVNGSLFYGGRASLLYTPSDKLKIILRGSYGKNDKADITINYMQRQDSLNLLNVPEEEFDHADRKVFTSFNEPFFKRDQYSGVGKVVYRLNNIHTLTSITALNGSDGSFAQDFDGSSADAVEVFRGTEIDAFSQEIRISTPRENRKLFYVGGLYYLNETIFNHDKLDYRPDLFPAIALESGSPELIDLIDLIDDYTETGESFATIDSRSYAGFLSTSYEISERIRFNGGLRLSHEEKDLTYYQTVVPYHLFDPLAFVAVSIPKDDPVTNDISNTVLSWNIGMDFKTADETLIYMNVSRGFKAAGFNIILSDAMNVRNIGAEFKPEFTYNYELGLKMRIDNRYLFNVAAFVTDFRDKQEALFRNNQIIIANARAVQGQGIEAEFTGVWNKFFKTDVSLGALNIEYLDFEVPLSDTLSLNISGNKVYKAPNVTFRFAPEFHTSIGKELRMMIRADYSYVGKTYNDIFNTEIIARQGTGLLNGRISFSTRNERYSISIWGKNLTDKTYIQHGWLAVRGNQAAVNPPRTLGVELRANFY